MVVDGTGRNPPKVRPKRRAVPRQGLRWGYLVPMPGVKYYAFASRRTRGHKCRSKRS